MFPVASERVYRDGEIVYEEGSAGDWIYVVLSGSVEISKKSGGGKTVLSRAGSGDFFGEHSYLGGVKRATTVRSIGESTIGIIDRILLDREFNMLSSSLRGIIRSLAGKHSELLDKVIDLFPPEKEPVPKSLSLTFRDPRAFIRAYTGNPDRKGLFIRTDKYFEQGQKITLKLKLPNLPCPISIESVVAWTRKQSEDPQNRPSGMGIHFTHISEHDELLLNRYFREVMDGPNYEIFDDVSPGRRRQL